MTKKGKILSITSSLILLIIVISASYAYMGSFTEEVDNKTEVNISAKKVGNASFIATAADLNINVPLKNMMEGSAGLASSDNASITVNLTGISGYATTCTYDIVFEYDLNSEVYGQSVPVTQSGSKEITLEVSSSNGTNNYATEKNFNYDSSWIEKTSSTGAKKTLVKGVTIVSTGTLTTQTTNIIGRYYNLNVSQASLADKYFTGKIYVENNKCTVGDLPKAKETILLNNGGEASIKSKGTPDFTQTATTNEGMYAMEDDLGTSYYFRGAVDNNWVKFGKDSSGKDMYWRIIRINGDGSVRIIYTGTSAPTQSTKVVMTGTGTQIGTSDFNSSDNSSEYVGYMYTIGEQHGTSVDSTIKTTLDNWYKTTTLETDAGTKTLVADGVFCSDRNLESGSWSSTTSNAMFYATYVRLFGNSSNASPSLKCTTVSDKFTVNNSNGNGALTYPIGLITADEIMFAGTDNKNSNNTNYYLYTNSVYWSFSPSMWFTSHARSYTMHLLGYLSTYNVSNDYGVRPVISLSKDAKLSGDGTYNNVYTVS